MVMVSLVCCCTMCVFYDNLIQFVREHLSCDLSYNYRLSLIISFIFYSPLQSAVSVGSRVLPALLDIRMKMANTHAHHVWAAKDELPVSIFNIMIII